MTQVDTSGYRYQNPFLNDSHIFLLPQLLRILEPFAANSERVHSRLFDLGCGNGSVANVLQDRGWDVTGVDPSVECIEYAKKAYPHLKLESGSAYDDLAARYGRFHVVVSL